MHFVQVVCEMLLGLGVHVVQFYIKQELQDSEDLLKKKVGLQLRHSTGVLVSLQLRQFVEMAEHSLQDWSVASSIIRFLHEEQVRLLIFP